MSVKIRLAITGRKHQLSYRVVAQDTRSKRDGNFLEILGFLNPNEKEARQHFLDKNRVKFWVSKGATFTPTAKYVFEKGQLPPKPKNKKKEAKKAQEVAAAAAAATPAPDATPEGAENPPESTKPVAEAEKTAPAEAPTETAPAQSAEATATEPAVQEEAKAEPATKPEAAPKDEAEKAAEPKAETEKV